VFHWAQNTDNDQVYTHKAKLVSVH
jgi:hypothetical protein